ncbi:hypothetical protein [Catellatospora sp. NPDC049609]|uniref:hypothetical protein n=1 Tax=Catellatospora sp. NPDC049609 TaxID=3155505 RepID=UPI0034371981
MGVYDYYGLRQPDVSARLGQLAELLMVTWQERGSDYFGTYFKARAVPFGGGTFKVQPNDLVDENGPYLLKPEYPEHRYLLLVEKCPEADRVREVLSAAPEWEFLHRTVVGSPA